MRPAPNSTEEVDPATVERLVHAIGLTLENAYERDVTNQGEIISALFTTLDRILRAQKQLETMEDRFHNAREVKRVLEDMIYHYGMIEH